MWWLRSQSPHSDEARIGREIQQALRLLCTDGNRSSLYLGELGIQGLVGVHHQP